MAAPHCPAADPLCAYCGARGCPLKHIPQAHRIRRRWWPLRRR